MRVPQRGRAILRRLSASESSRGFRPGDFLLTTSDGALAKLQGWATSCELNHAALIVDQLGTTVEANPSLAGGKRPFRLGSVKDRLAAGRPCWIGYVELREGSRHDVVEYAQHLIRAPYHGSGSGRVWLALHTLFGITPRALAGRTPLLNGLYRLLNNHALVIREEHCYLAGEFVARALERGGFIWESDPAYVTPADLLTSFHQLDALLEARPSGDRRAISQTRAENAPRRAALATALHSRGTLDASVLPMDSRVVEAPPAGIQAIARVGVFMAASLAVIGLLEETIRFVAREA